MNARDLRKRLGLTPRQFKSLVERGLPHHPHPKDKRRRDYNAAEVRDWLITNGFADDETKEPILATRVECASYFNVATRTVADWLNDPSFPGRSGKPGRKDGYFPVWQIQAWRATQTIDGGSVSGIDDELMLESRAARAKGAIVDFKMKEITLAERLKHVADVEAMRRLYVQTHSFAKTIFGQVWARIRLLLPSLPAAKVDELQGAVERVCNDTASAFRDGIRKFDLLVGRGGGDNGSASEPGGLDDPGESDRGKAAEPRRPVSRSPPAELVEVGQPRRKRRRASKKKSPRKSE